METEQFVTDYYFQLIEESEAKFIFEHAEKMLKDTLDTNTLIVTRVTTLTTVTSTLLIALFGFSIGRFDIHKTDTLFITGVVGIFYLFIIAVMLFLNIRPNSYYSVGAEPKDFFNRALINKNNASYRMISFYVNEIHEYQKRILCNKYVNNKRWRLYKISLSMLVVTPILLSIVYWILTVL
jgi:hypothetical protein